MNHARKLGLGTLVGFAAWATVIFCTASNAWAVVLAYEGFDYTPGAFLVDSATGAPVLNGGTGWAAAWDDTAGPPVAPVTHFSSVIQADSLQYTDSLGNALVTTGGSLLGSGETGTSQPGRTLAARRSSPEAGDTVTTWISFVGKRIGAVNMDTPPNPNGFDGTYRRGANLAFFDNDPIAAASQPEKLNFGESSNYQYPLGGTPPMYEDRWQARDAGVPATVLVPQPYAPNPTGAPTGTATTAQVRDAFSSTPFTQQSLAVIRIDHVPGDANAATTGGSNGGNDNIYIWMNPDLSSTPSDASASIKFVSADIVAAANALATPVAPYLGNPTAPGTSPGGETNFDRLRLFFGNINGTTPFAQMLFDELRVGETFADVAPFTPGGSPGDFDADGNVNAADYTIWRDNQGAATEESLNGGGDNLNGVDDGDYELWNDNFDLASGAGGASGVVPEPGSFLLAVVAAIAMAYSRRRVG